MAFREMVISVGLVAAASPVAASTYQVAPTLPAPPGTPDTLYCMRVEPMTGSRIESVKCWTRQEWADNEVDVDVDWAEEGVAIIVDGVTRPAAG